MRFSAFGQNDIKNLEEFGLKEEGMKRTEQNPMEYVGNQEYKPIAKKLIRKRN